jgi:hypothetical protein
MQGQNPENRLLAYDTTIHLPSSSPYTSRTDSFLQFNAALQRARPPLAHLTATERVAQRVVSTHGDLAWLTNNASADVLVAYLDNVHKRRSAIIPLEFPPGRRCCTGLPACLCTPPSAQALCLQACTGTSVAAPSVHPTLPLHALQWYPPAR